MKNYNIEPKFRFKGYPSPWESKSIEEVLDRYSNPVEVNQKTFYKQIGIRSHGKGIFHKEQVSGKQLGNKRVFWLKKDLFVLNIVFAWEQAIAKTTESEEGLIASHRFPLYIPIEKKLNLDFILYFFKRAKGKYILELASPGGAGRNKTLGQKEFANTKIKIPCIEEQQKIASFLLAVDKRIVLMKKKKRKLEEYKNGVIHEIFNQKIRFNDNKGNEFPKWEKSILKEKFQFLKGKGLSKSHLDKNGENECILYGELFTTYNTVIKNIKSKTNSNESFDSEIGDLLIPSSTTTSAIDLANVTALLKKNVKLGGDLIILRAKKENCIDSIFFAYYLTHNKKNEIAKRAQGITIIHLYSSNISDLIIELPVLEEQNKIATFLTSIDDKISLVDQQIEASNKFKKGLLQQMFV